jgi:Tol biopolymer transport system component
MGAEGSNAHALTTSTFDENNASVSPDGNSIVFETNRLGGSTNLFTMPLTGGEPKLLTGFSSSTTGSEIDPWWSN